MKHGSDNDKFNMNNVDGCIITNFSICLPEIPPYIDV